MEKFELICNNIKNLKIQGARNIAIAGLKALKIDSSEKAINHLLSLRATEPTLRNAINYAKKNGIDVALNYFDKTSQLVHKNAAKLIKNNYIIYTHCHSSMVIESLKEALPKKFIVNNTETRPKFQGRITSLELSKLNIPNNHFIDSAMRLAIKHATIAMLGCDAITYNCKIINKIGSELVAETCYTSGVPLYIITNSWKYDNQSSEFKPTIIEERPPKEIWGNPPKNIKIHNYAFEKINPEIVTAIVSEFGILKPKQFVKLARENLR
ncbi:MAG TPA: hypothetical protein VJB89_04110 [Candidatus Nanoarchaeia archaeon]|uniref:R15P Isomerase n=2 Tax=Nanobdellati TaxID=1783276 RepID=A0A447IU83_9ARCH|nr:R15P Isomerase [uncultured DPANN archaeon]VDS11088.1 R15P Isomerase [uncultured Candidatus Woesearchaeota archaeon]HLD11242.1 hypothetical protein [Candidatus Nanoarchaeia archaeon]